MIVLEVGVDQRLLSIYVRIVNWLDASLLLLLWLLVEYMIRLNALRLDLIDLVLWIQLLNLCWLVLPLVLLMVLLLPLGALKGVR